MPHDPFVRGDVNGDGAVDLSDAVGVLACFYLGSKMPCEDRVDANDDGQVDVTDAIRLLDYLYRGGPAPPAPFPAKGLDPTLDAFPCGD